MKTARLFFKWMPDALLAAGVLIATVALADEAPSTSPTASPGPSMPAPSSSPAATPAITPGGGAAK